MTDSKRYQYYRFFGNVLISSILICGVHAADVADISRLRQVLMRNYDNHSRPVQQHSNATNVHVNFYYKGIEVDERRQSLTIHLLAVFFWEDQHMKWDPKDYRNLSSIFFASYELWKPDLGVFNNIDESEIDHFGNTQLEASYTSMVSWVPHVKFQVGCQFDATYWPFDIQNCYIQIGSWAHNADQIYLLVKENDTLQTDDTEYYTVHKDREWDIISNSINLRTFKFSCCTELYQDVLISLQLRRKGSTYNAVVIMAAYGIAFTILLSFWLSPLAYERIPVIITVLLLNTLLLNNIYKMISCGGKNVPLVLGYYRDSVIMVTFALLWTILLRYIASSKRSSPVPLPGFVSTFLESWASVILCLNSRPKQRGPAASSGETEDDEKDLVAATNPYQEDWAWLAYFLDRLMFLVYLIIYICFFIAFF